MKSIINKSKLADVFKGLLLTFIPSSMRNERFARTIARWFLIGLILRLIFLPFATHSDLIAYYWRAHFITYHNAWNLSRFLAENYGFLVGNITMHHLHSIFLLPVKYLIPNSEMIWSHSGNICQFAMHYDLYLAEWFKFINQENIFTLLILLKLPFLIFDFACAFFFLHVIGDEKKGSIFFIFWMINPVNIFVTYIFSRFDVITLFVIMLSLYYAKKNRYFVSALVLGIAITTRDYPFLFLPFFILQEKGLLRRIFIAILAFIPWSIIDFFNILTKVKPETAVLLQTTHSNYFLSMPLNLYWVDNAFPFVIGYTLIFLFMCQKKTFSFELLYKSITLLLLLYYAICFFHPQYFIWLSPFVALIICEDKKYVRYYIYMIPLLFIYTFYWGRALSSYLFAPLNPEFFWNLPSPTEIISIFYDANKFIGISRSVFSGICVWVMYNIFKDISRTE